MVQLYTQLVIRSMEIESQIAFDSNSLSFFRDKCATFKHSLRKKWATFKQCPSEKIIWSIQLVKVQVTNGQMGEEDQKTGSLLLIVNL